MISAKLFQRRKPGILNLVWRVRRHLLESDSHVYVGREAEGNDPSRGNGIAVLQPLQRRRTGAGLMWLEYRESGQTGFLRFRDRQGPE